MATSKVFEAARRIIKSHYDMPQLPTDREVQTELGYYQDPAHRSDACFDVVKSPLLAKLQKIGAVD